MWTNVSLERKNSDHTACVIQDIKLDDRSDHFWPCNILILKNCQMSTSFYGFFPPHEVQRTLETHPSSPGFYYKSSFTDSTKALEIKYFFISNFCE